MIQEMANIPSKTMGLAKFSSNFRNSQSCCFGGYLRLAILHKAVSQSLKARKFSKFPFVFLFLYMTSERLELTFRLI